MLSLADTVILVDENCSLANAIRSANGEAQVEEAGDADGNDDCELGTEPQLDADPPEDGSDIIRLTRNVTLSEELPVITTAVQIEGKNRTLSGDDSYAGIHVQGGSLAISDITIAQMTSIGSGGALHIFEGELEINNSIINNNSAGDVGGGIYASDSKLAINDSYISNNNTLRSHGGGVYFVSSDNSHVLEARRTVFYRNVSTEDGGGLKISGGTVFIDKSTFNENSADEGGGIEINEATIEIVNSTFSNNEAREGGGMSAFSSDVTLTHTTWAYNTAAEQGGAIAIIGWTGTVRFRNTLITDSLGGKDCHSGPNEEVIVEFTGNFIQDGTCTPEEDFLESQSFALEGEAESQAADEASDEQSQDSDEAEANIEGSEGQSANEDGDEAIDASAEAQHIPAPDIIESSRIANLKAQHLPDEKDHEHLGDTLFESLQGTLPHHPLRWGSPAIDGGDPNFCQDDDQIDTERPQFDNCDIGAYEYPKPPPPPPTPTPRPEEQDPPPPPPPTQPSQLLTPQPPGAICIPHDRVVIHSDHNDLRCEIVDLLQLDKHPAIQAGRLAVRVWRTVPQCTHHVAAGETLYSLAARYNTTAEAIRSHNGLGSDALSLAQALNIPGCADAMDLQAQICFADAGNIALIDTSQSPPAVRSLVTYNEDEHTCADLDRAGTVILTGT